MPASSGKAPGEPREDELAATEPGGARLRLTGTALARVHVILMLPAKIIILFSPLGTRGEGKGKGRGREGAAMRRGSRQRELPGQEEPQTRGRPSPPSPHS